MLSSILIYFIQMWIGWAQIHILQMNLFLKPFFLFLFREFFFTFLLLGEAKIF